MGQWFCGTTRTFSRVSSTSVGAGVKPLRPDERALPQGDDIIVERRGQAVAAVVSIGHLEELRSLRADVTSAALILARELADTGRRTGLDDALAAIGLDRAELDAELADDIAAGGA